MDFEELITKLKELRNLSVLTLGFYEYSNFPDKKYYTTYLKLRTISVHQNTQFESLEGLFKEFSGPCQWDQQTKILICTEIKIQRVL